MVRLVVINLNPETQPVGLRGIKTGRRQETSHNQSLELSSVLYLTGSLDRLSPRPPSLFCFLSPLSIQVPMVVGFVLDEE